jgi:chorismate mutase/prephenate dehydratase
MNAELHDNRKMIDAIDRQLIDLISQRISAVHKIGQAKNSDDSMPLVDPQREREVFDRWAKAATEAGLSSYYVGRILREMLNYSRRVQEGELNREEVEVSRPVTRVGYQGVAFSYSFLATRKLFECRDKTCVEPIGFRTFPAAVEALTNQEVDYALLPIENTVAGSLNETYRLLKEKNLAVVDEEIWSVEHCLVGLPGSNLDEVRTIRSHPVALQQCQTFLAKTTWASAEVYFDTAAAAESLVTEGDPSVAAICSAECAAELGLTILKERVADQHNNYTRFVLVAREAEKVDRRQRCKTSLRFAVCHRQGALARILQAFAERQINLTKLESRPKPESPWEYEFYADVEGHQEDPALAEALEVARGHTNYLRILGSYPWRSEELAKVPDHIGGHATETAVTCKPSAASKATSKPTPVTSVRPTVTVNVGTVEFGGPRFVVIAGPCAVEDRQQMLDAAMAVKEYGGRALRGGAFKPRSSPDSFQGLGWPGVQTLVEVGRSHELPVVTEVMHPDDVDRMAASVDAIQVGARNMQNFALLKKLGTIDRPIVLKRGLSATIDELLKAAEYITSAGNQRVILCERGIRTFETATRSTLDLSAVPALRQRTDLPVIVDPSHAAGDRQLVIPLALAAAAVGADGLLVEVHPRPEEALCDGPQALTPDDFRELMGKLGPILSALGRKL